MFPLVETVLPYPAVCVGLWELRIAPKASEIKPRGFNTAVKHRPSVIMWYFINSDQETVLLHSSQHREVRAQGQSRAAHIKDGRDLVSC